MTYLMVLGIYFAVLAILFFAGKKAIGLPLLGLAAGALIANLWTGELTPLVANAGFAVTSPPLTSIVAVALTFLPSILLLLRAPKTDGKLKLVINSLVYGLVGVALTYAAFSNAVVLDDASSAIVAQIMRYSNLVITVGIVIAIFDVLSAKKSKGPGRPKK